MRYSVRHITIEGARRALNLDASKTSREAIEAIVNKRGLEALAALEEARETEDFEDAASASWHAVALQHKPDTFDIFGYVFDETGNMIDAFDWEPLN